MDMPKDNKNKPVKNNKLLTRGAKVKTNNTVNRLDFIKRIENEIPQKKQTSNTIRVTVKVDNHTRNKLLSLTTLGYGDSIGAIIKDLVDSKVNKLCETEIERFKFLYDTYEVSDLKKEKNEWKNQR